MITGQVQNIVFDGSKPVLTSLVVERETAFPWLVQCTDTAGNVVDMSSSTATSWSAAFGIAQDYGDGGPIILAVLSTTATANGSQISFPNGGSDGQVLVYLAPNDTKLLPSPATVGAEAYCVFSFVLTDLAGIPYVVARGVLYPQEHILTAAS